MSKNPDRPLSAAVLVAIEGTQPNLTRENIDDGHDKIPPLITSADNVAQINQINRPNLLS